MKNKYDPLKQPKALRLAAMYDADYWPGGMSINGLAYAAAAELRRQHAEIEALRAQVQIAKSALTNATNSPAAKQSGGMKG